MKAAEGFFAHHHGEVSMLQGAVGLIGTYLSPTGAFTLRSTGRLGGVKGPGRRLSQSSRPGSARDAPGGPTPHRPARHIPCPDGPAGGA